NNVDGIFSGQLGLQVGVASLEVYDTTSDPFSTTTNASTLLRELASVRRGNPDLRSSGLTHLFTGRDFDGDTVGVAYLDAVCDPQLGAGITELRGRTAFYESLITAHEIGHNFGAPHDGEEGPCLTTPESFLMSARLNGSDTFSACSLDQIGPRIAGATCIRALPAIDLAASAATASRRILAGRDASFEFAITNVGGSQATVARAIVTASGAGIEIVDVAVSQGTCTKSVVAAICDIAEVAPDSPVDLTVTARSSQVTEGTIGIEAESTSTDANAANDAAVTRVSVENGTDLVVTLGAPSPVDVERAFDLEASLENRASIAATNAVMAVEVPAQIAIVSASLPGGTCTVAPASVRCEQAVIDAGRRITATIALRATSAGALRIAATGRADQLELTPADNEASLTVSAASAVGGITTTTNEGGGGGGGGGRVTPALLLLLLSAAAISRSARAHAARARTPSSQRSSDLGSRAPD
ncbi:MAG TPA: zinc-dependent metalloprotease family protein, partial [Steroidobacteraceae bacterium]|nr:zinc-dependent metalloprotease family protein [Steroidobacteraceae bacterium]